jgi:respiratory burst oxidase
MNNSSNKAPQTQLGKNVRKRLDRSKSGVAVALKGLQFVTAKVGHDGWAAVEKRFNEASPILWDSNVIQLLVPGG